MSSGSFAWSVRERREADLFLADLLGHASRAEYGEQLTPQVCGFFRPNNSVRTLAQLRAAIVTRCAAEWNAWHTGGTPRPECDLVMFGRLIGYYLAGNRNLLADSLTRIQANALGAINYGPLVGPTKPPAAQIAAIRTRLLAGAPGAAAASPFVDVAMPQARQGHRNLGQLRDWSAAFVSACVRGAAISEGIEAVTLPGRTTAGQDRPLRPSLSHVVYVSQARDDRAAGRQGRYHAFEPSARPPQLADIIVQDRRDDIRPDEVTTLATLPVDAEIHGDIVVEVTPDSVVTIGGNVADGVRRRRYPRDTASGLLVTTVPRLYGQENDAGILPPVAGTSCQALADKSTRRVFALLSLVEDCRAVPSGGGSGSGPGSGSGAGRGSGAEG